ncbi:hypothetical protein AD006_22160 [Pseudonocardia sp. EC080610-09]|uniref:MFS transporter n=1 Tax=unclassified Pseudonocardia TaxID=2619320 RepID=UPI000706BFB7|nr:MULTISPECIES: MFS transporter [unclassified Pseudonocardia]ALL77337.1 hypothetical protein AD006_22160 [Pseudonocardia sp. EC080610-09]ALL80253.1 hypothetical protein AD017_01745 [Pseudonocardia sp. EC080619-01]
MVTPDPEPPTVTYRALFGVGEFRAIGAAHALSILGDVVGALAVTVLVFQQTAAPLLAALAFSLVFLPHLLGGALVPVVMRFRPRPLAVVCNVVSAGLVGVLSLPGIPAWVLLAVMFVVGLLAPVSVGVRSAMLPDILGEGPLFVLGRGAIRLTSQSSMVVGNLLGGASLLFLTPQGALLADALTFVAAALLLRFGTRDRGWVGAPTPGDDRGLGTFREIWSYPPVRRLLLIGWLTPSFAIASEALAAPYVAAVGRPERELALMLSASAAGMVVSDLAASRMLRPVAQRRLIAPGAVLLCAPLLLFVFSPPLPVAVGLMFLSGLGLAYNAGLDSLLAERTPSRLLPRTLAYQYVFLLGVQGAIAVGWGGLGELVEPGAAIAMAGLAGVVVVSLLTFRVARPQRAPAAAGREST